jgi:hypothetical protein
MAVAAISSATRRARAVRIGGARRSSVRRRWGKGRPVQRAAAASPDRRRPRRSDTYYETKRAVTGALIEAIDLGQLAKLDADSAREEIRDIVNEIIAIKKMVMSMAARTIAWPLRFSQASFLDVPGINSRSRWARAYCCWSWS